MRIPYEPWSEVNFLLQCSQAPVQLDKRTHGDTGNDVRARASEELCLSPQLMMNGTRVFLD